MAKQTSRRHPGKLYLHSRRQLPCIESKNRRQHHNHD
jgi:hypothetical protein